MPQPERSYFKKNTITWIMGALSAAYIVAFFFTGWLPAAGIKTQQWRTQSNGFVLNFTIALRYSRVDKPSDYSEETITQQAQEVTSTCLLYTSPPSMRFGRTACTTWLPCGMK